MDCLHTCVPQVEMVLVTVILVMYEWHIYLWNIFLNIDSIFSDLSSRDRCFWEIMDKLQDGDFIKTQITFLKKEKKMLSMPENTTSLWTLLRCLGLILNEELTKKSEDWELFHGWFVVAFNKKKDVGRKKEEKSRTTYSLARGHEGQFSHENHRSKKIQFADYLQSNTGGSPSVLPVATNYISILKGVFIVFQLAQDFHWFCLHLFSRN